MKEEKKYKEEGGQKPKPSIKTNEYLMADGWKHPP